MRRGPFYGESPSLESSGKAKGGRVELSAPKRVSQKTYGMLADPDPADVGGRGIRLRKNGRGVLA